MKHAGTITVPSIINATERLTIAVDASPASTGIAGYVLLNPDGDCRDMSRRKAVTSVVSEQDTEARYTSIT